MSDKIVGQLDEKLRGWEAIEHRLRRRDMSAGDLAEARKSFYEGIEILSKLFLSDNCKEELSSKKDLV
ncbi:MAG: hypothetical protein ABH914_02625 [Candidatus Omnitrophota bacterium]